MAPPGPGCCIMVRVAVGFLDGRERERERETLASGFQARGGEERRGEVTLRERERERCLKTLEFRANSYHVANETGKKISADNGL